MLTIEHRHSRLNQALSEGGGTEVSYTFMGGGRENLNLQSQTGEVMDQPSVQHDHVDVAPIPPATDASNFMSSKAAAVGLQTLNLPSVVPREVVSADVSTSTANTQGRSCAPRQRRCRWNNPCSWLPFDFYSTSIQTILLVVFLPIFRDEPAHMILQAYVIGCGAGCLLYRWLFRPYILTYMRSREQSNRPSQAVCSVSPGSEVGKSQTGRRERFGIQILKWLWTSLDTFFELWFYVGIGIVYTHWITRQAPHLNWLCTVFLVIGCFRFILPMAICIMMSIWWGVSTLTKLATRSKSKRDFGTANVQISCPGF